MHINILFYSRQWYNKLLTYATYKVERIYEYVCALHNIEILLLLPAKHSIRSSKFCLEKYLLNNKYTTINSNNSTWNTGKSKGISRCSFCRYFAKATGVTGKHESYYIS